MNLKTHSKEACKGRNCCIHNPSNHHMRAWPLNWRSDAGKMERVCPHGVGHPDPDDVAYHMNLLPEDSYYTVHGCDGCCVKKMIALNHSTKKPFSSRKPRKKKAAPSMHRKLEEEFKYGVRTSGKVYYQRISTHTCFVKDFSEAEKDQLKKPHSHIRNRLASMLKQLRKGVDLERIIFSRTKRHLTEY